MNTDDKDIWEKYYYYTSQPDRERLSYFSPIKNVKVQGTGFEPHVLFEVVIKRFIGIPLNSIPSGTIFHSAVICLNLLVSIIRANPFIVFLLVKVTEFVFNVCVDIEIMVFPVLLIPIVNALKIT